MLGIITGYEMTNLINKEMQKDLLALAYINPKLILDEDNPETGEPYNFLDFCIITNDVVTPEVKTMAESHLNVEDVYAQLNRVPYLDSNIYQLILDYLELLKSMEIIEVQGEKGTFQEWTEVMWQRLTKQEREADLIKPYLKYIMIDDETLAEIYDKTIEEIEEYNNSI